MYRIPIYQVRLVLDDSRTQQATRYTRHRSF